MTFQHSPDRRQWLLATLAGVGALQQAHSENRAGNAASSNLPMPPVPASDNTRSLTERLESLRQSASQLLRLRSLVVMHEGEVVLAEAFSGPPVDAPINVKSVSKSIVAGLVGCAVQRNIISSVSLTLGETIPDLLPDKADPRVASLTLENLLTMQAGLQRTSGRNYGQWVASDDWVEYVLSRPFVAEPAGRMLYSTGDWHVLGAVLSRLTDASLLDLSREWLGEPLDIDFAPWTRDPQGRYMGGNEMSLSPLHMARFGELYRRGGYWQKKQILGKQWVRNSFTPRTRSPYSGDQYGYGWFIRWVGASGFAYARGYGGQFIHVLPLEGIVVAMTSDWTRSARGGNYTEQLHDLVISHLLQA